VLRVEGYSQVSLSGGEPLVYRPLGRLVERAHELHFRVTVVTNGLLAQRRLGPMLPLLDGIAVSFDGLLDRHNAMRGREDAFDRAAVALRWLAEQGAPVGAAISLTRDGIPELPELADRLVELGDPGAPGRARRPCPRAGFELLPRRQRQGAPVPRRPRAADGATRGADAVRPRPRAGAVGQRDAYAGLLADCGDAASADRPLADLVNPLVITDTSALKPIAYDFDDRFDVGSLDGLSQEALRSYKQERADDLRALVGGALAGIADRNDLVDWFDHCARLSEVAPLAA
jgi:Fe-coproporphyrin III synthase